MKPFPEHLRVLQQGFSIVVAVFILVVLGLLGSYMVRMFGVQQTTSTYALQGARAYQAARAGLSWGAARISAGGSCSDVIAQNALSFPGITGFTVAFTCTSTAYKEGSDTPRIYLINAQSEYGTYGTADYVSREMEMTIVK